MFLTESWDRLVVPDDLVRFVGPDARGMVANPALAAWAELTPTEDGVLQALADGVSPPADLAAPELERALATLVLRWLAYLPGKQPVPRDETPTFEIIYYAITDGCNLRCPYCYASSTRKLPGELEPAESLDVVRQAAELGARTIVLTGGEPMLRRDFFDIAAYARELGLRVNTITNATLIPDDRTAERIAELFDTVTVSMDGGTAELHERTRGQGTFAKTVGALRRLNAAGVHPIINHVVSEQNVDHLADLALTLEGITTRQVRLMHHSALGRGAHDGVSFEWDQYRTAHEFVWTSPLAKNLLPDGPIAAKPCSLRGNCGLGGTEIYVDSLGDVYPCKLITDGSHKAGNVREKSLADIYAHPMMADLRASSVLREINLTDCSKCYIRGGCGGGCRAYHMARSGDLKKNARSFCRVLRHQMVTSMWVSLGASRDTLVDAGDAPFVPYLVRGGAIHPVYDDWQREAGSSLAEPAPATPGRRTLPLLPI